MMVRAQFYLLATWLLCGCIAGCGSASTMVPVTGVVKFDSKPLDTGLIEFYPVAPTPGAMAGSSINQGAYSIPADKGLQIKGKYTVKITATRKIGKQVANIMSPAGGQMDLFEQYLPAAYNTKSKLEITIPEGDQRKFDFELNGDGK